MTDTEKKPPSKAALRRAEVAAAQDRLRAILKPGDQLWIVRRRFQRAQHPETFDVVRLYVTADGACLPQTLTSDVATAFDSTCYTDGLKTLDRYALGSMLWPDGFACVGKGCPSPEHGFASGASVPEHHRSGAYALRFDAL